MRKLFLTLTLLFSFLVTSHSSGVQGATFYFPTDNSYGWQLSSDASCGMGAVYVKVIRSTSTNGYGNYLYSILMSTNSYWNNCNPANTYVDNIYISYYNESMKGYYYPSNYYPFWVVVGGSQTVYTFYSADPSEEFYVSIGNIIPNQ